MALRHSNSKANQIIEAAFHIPRVSEEQPNRLIDRVVRLP